MKRILIFTIVLTGNLFSYYYFKLPGFEWYHIPLVLGAQLVIVPAILWWEGEIIKKPKKIIQLRVEDYHAVTCYIGKYLTDMECLNVTGNNKLNFTNPSFEFSFEIGKIINKRLVELQNKSK